MSYEIADLKHETGKSKETLAKCLLNFAQIHH